MSELGRLTAGVLVVGMAPGWAIADSPQTQWLPVLTGADAPTCARQGRGHCNDLALSNGSPLKGTSSPTVSQSTAVTEIHAPEFSRRSSKPQPLNSSVGSLTPQNWLPVLPDFRPYTGTQLYHQRWAALRQGTIYTRLPSDSLRDFWINAEQRITYEQWVGLLRQEARAIANGQGNNHLSIILGDSLSQWIPPEHLPRNGLWLNQAISGDTTAGVLRRLSAFANTRPDKIHLMIGINDLRQGKSDAEILNNIYEIVARLQQTHPQAEIVLYSILPTRLPTLPTSRIQRINRVIEAIAQYTDSRFLNLHPHFSDETGSLHRDLTTDGLHLSQQGYGVWQWAMRQI